MKFLDLLKDLLLYIYDVISPILHFLWVGLCYILKLDAIILLVGCILLILARIYHRKHK